ncbi:MAG: penicillin acylase family protein, partial [Terracidiphilus sp.]
MAESGALNYSAQQTSTLPSSRRSRRWTSIFLWSLSGLVIFFLLAAGAGVLWLRSAAQAALPVLDGDLHLAGLSAPVTVRRDAHGVPHIEAATQQDLFFAQGYVTAQDRLWQMDAFRRDANGDLAEILGPSLVKHDLARRVLQFRNTARRIYDNLPEDDRARLNAYARGVNLFISTHQDTLPTEFKLLHYRPQPWTGADSVSIGTLMVETLDTHWDVKLARQQIAARLHNPKLESDLYPVGSWRDHPPTGVLVDLSQPRAEPPPSSDDDEDDERTQTRLVPQAPVLRPGSTVEVDIRQLRSTLGLPTCTGCTPGSNNWVIAGTHTASGKPLLSNDMHLSLTVPNIWYMVDLRAPGYHVAGVALTGFPYIIAGHNEHVAWGLTALSADVQDLYVEKLDGKGNYQSADGSWKPLAVDHEVIRVRGGKNVTLDVQSTGHGPLLNPILPGESQPLALKWTLYDSTLNTIPLYALNVASNWTAFSAALAQWNWPTQNVVYSDDQG